MSPSMFMLWDFPDYGPLDKPGEGVEFVAWHENVKASSWNSSNHADLVSHRENLDPDMTFSYHKKADSDDDRGGDGVAEEGHSRKRSWSEISGLELHSQIDDNLENTPFPWMPRLCATNKRPRADERSIFDDALPNDHDPSPISNLGVGVAALLSILSQDKKRKKRRNTSYETDNREDLAHQFEIRPISPTSPTVFSSVSDDNHDTLSQPETRSISQEQLVAEVKDIYAGLVMVDAKCIEVDNKQATLVRGYPHAQPNLDNERWQALIASHRTLPHEHHDFFLSYQHPSASPSLGTLVGKYALRTFDPHRMSIEDEDIRDRDWYKVARYWYENVASITNTDQKDGMQQGFENSRRSKPRGHVLESSETSLDASFQSVTPVQDTPSSQSTITGASKHICGTCNASFPATLRAEKAHQIPHQTACLSRHKLPSKLCSTTGLETPSESCA